MSLFCKLLQHEVRHDVVGLDGLREGRVVPEGVRKRIEEDEACIDAGAQIGAVQVGGSAEQGIPAAGDEESGRQAVQIRVDGRQHRIFRIGRADIIGVVNAAVGWIEMACESLKRVERLGVGLLVEPVEGAEDAKGRGHGQAEQFEFHRHFRGEHGPRGSSVENDVAGFVGLEQFPVDGDSVVDCGGKWMFRGEAVEHCDDLDSGVAGDGNRFGERTGVGVKATSVQVEENLVAATAGQVGWSDDADRHAGNG